MNKVNENIKKEIIEYIQKYKTKSIYGFNKKEINKILKKFPQINEEFFNNAIGGATGIMNKNEFIYYHDYIINAVKCGLENKNLSIWIWD